MEKQLTSDTSDLSLNNQFKLSLNITTLWDKPIQGIIVSCITNAIYLFIWYNQLNPLAISLYLMVLYVLFKMISPQWLNDTQLLE